MDKMKGGPSMKQKTEELLFRNDERKRLEMDREGEQESEAVEIK